MPHHRVPPRLRAFARRMRSDQTDAEALLWWAIRRRDLGVKFRRQHPVGRYIVDFVCLECGLVVDVDGEQHGGPDDAHRDADLRRRGFQVLRVWNGDVFSQLDNVLGWIVDALEDASGS